MIGEQIILDYPTECDICNHIIKAGEPLFPIYQVFDLDDMPIEELRNRWILSLCQDCVLNSQFLTII